MEAGARHHRWRRRVIAAAIGLCACISHAAMAKPMEFEIVEQRYHAGGDGITAAIFAYGDITEDTAKRFDELVESNRIKDAVVYFDSTGGLVVESIRLGQSIRRHSFGTSVQKLNSSAMAMCASACVYAYAGGVARYLDDDRGRIGVHQYYAARKDGAPTVDKDDLKVAQLLGSVIVAHLQQMGVSSALYVAAAMTDSGSMLWMGRKEGESFDLVNNGELPPSADIRLTDDGKPYLQITQVADKGETRVVISCDASGITLASGATGDPLTLRLMRGQAVRNALEIDGRPFYPAEGQAGMTDVGDGGVQTDRRIDAATLAEVDKAGTLGFSVEGISGSWKREIDVVGLREKIAYYTRTCAGRR